MKEEKDNLSEKRGYLKEDFQFFHLKDKKNIEFEAHYHEFNKILIFISGKVTYLIEGKAYKLKPWDILLISSNEVHKPLIDSDETYDRIVIWVNSTFLIKHNNRDCNLLNCFELALNQRFNLLRVNSELLRNIKFIVYQLEAASKSREFGSLILRNSLFLQLIVHLNRVFIGVTKDKKNYDIEYDENIGTILNYINENLIEELTIEQLSTKFFMSKYYLMHKFKMQTGYTIHNYILQKRLIMANSLIQKGTSITEVCIECGFGDYSSFLRSFKKMYGLSPKKHHKALIELEKIYKQDTHF